MTWRAAQDADLAQIQSFLRANLQSSMFLLGNINDYGLNDRTSDNGMTVWLSEAPIQGVFAISNSGTVLLQAPNADQAMWLSAVGLIADRLAVMGCMGETRQVRGFLDAAELTGIPTRLDKDEPDFSLNLKDLIIPLAKNAELMPLSAVSRELIQNWRTKYHREIFGTPKDAAPAAAAKDIDGYLDKDSHRVLCVSGQPVAMTGFNATLPDAVQIGGVYTPPDLRSRGYARLALALHLLEARRKGVAHSMLFAASTAAVRAYMAIGYQRAGSFSLVLFDRSNEVQT